ncbi:hypothetical protein GmHk_17G048660 [Glycine max]|nr:hypothetical protein GmHk_17G048660 [Glycine max]
MIQKILHCLTMKSDFMICIIKELKDLDLIFMDQLMGDEFTLSILRFKKRHNKLLGRQARRDQDNFDNNKKSQLSLSDRGREKDKDNFDRTNEKMYDKSNDKYYNCHKYDHF